MGHLEKKLDISIINNLGWHAKTNMDKSLHLTLEHFKNEIAKNKIREQLFMVDLLCLFLSIHVIQCFRNRLWRS